jgi:hypothetical protein
LLIKCKLTNTNIEYSIEKELKLLKRGSLSGRKILIQPHHIKPTQAKHIKLHPNKSENFNKLKSIIKSLDKSINNSQKPDNKSYIKSSSTQRKLKIVTYKLRWVNLIITVNLPILI